MPRLISVVNAFTSGVLSPGAYGRTDLDKYGAGLACCHNYTVDPLGGLIRRPGLRFVCETKLSQFSSRLFPFQFSVTDAYVLEAGCQYARFYKNNAVISDSSELITNGTFDSDLTGWTTATGGANGAAFWSGGTMRLVSVVGGDSGSGRQSATVTANQAYTVQFSISMFTGSDVRLLIGSSAGASDLLNTSLGTGTYTYSMTSSTTTLSVMFRAESGGRVADIDNVSVKLAQPYEITTPYDYSQLADAETLQSADEQYWLHACHQTRKLQRYGDTCWRFNCVTFSPPPSIEYGARSASDVQPAALTGNNVVFTGFNNGCTFMVADEGREIQIVSGANAGARAGIRHVSNGKEAQCNICIPFINTSINCAGTWKISGSPLTTVQPDDVDPVGKEATLTLSLAGWRNGNPGETDVGKFAIINGGTYEITCVFSNTVARTVIRGIQSGTLASGTRFGEKGAWSLEEALWSCVRGHARTGDFFQDRLWLDAGFRICGSKSSDYENFGVGTLDDDAVIFAINSKTINTIRAIVGGRQLQMFTTGGEYVATGGTDTPITATSVQLSNETTHGSSGVTPVRVSDVTLFLTRYGRQLREFTQRADVVSDAYVAPDLLLLASHLTKDHGIVDFAYQREPTATIWAIRADGVLLSCAYRREENVVAWATHDTCGLFESVTVIPHPDGDREQVWFIVNRTINSATKRYVEYLDDSPLTYDRRLTDSAVVYNNCVPVSVFTGLDHLECQRVTILADGLHVGTCVVAQGRVGIVTPASKVEVGLPYTSEAITLSPEVSFGAGSIQPMRKRWTRLFMRVKDSCGMHVRTSSGTLEGVKDQRGNVMAGAGVTDYDIPRLGDFVDASVTFRQDQPLPSHVLMIGGVLDVGDA